MKFYLVAVFSIFLSVSVLAQVYKESELPPKVLSTFQSNFSPTGKTTWTMKTGDYVAAFKENGWDVLASFGSDGALIESKSLVEYKEVPGAIASYIASNYSQAKVKSAYQRKTPTEELHYCIVLKQDGTSEVGELYFDMKGDFIKKNIPTAFINASAGTNVIIEPSVQVPKLVSDSFAAKLPGASLLYWKEDSNYIATFVLDEMTGRAEFDSKGVWHSTKYAVKESELPGPVITDIKANYKLYKVKYADLVTEPGKTDQYYVWAKKDGIDVPYVELYYTLTGKLTKKVYSEETKMIQQADNAAKENQTTDNNDADEIISKKELPSTTMNYIKLKYRYYEIKEAKIRTTTEGMFYIIKLKKSGISDTFELKFDSKGNFIEPPESD